jgi:hypothetical protein
MADFSTQFLRTRPWRVSVAAGVSTVALAAAPTTPAVAVDRIKAEHIAAHVKFLADDLLEGRAPATRGGDVAARYIATQFELLGLEPGGEPTISPCR